MAEQRSVWFGLACALGGIAVVIWLAILWMPRPPRVPSMETRETQAQLAVLLKHWHGQFGTYPPGDVLRIHPAATQIAERMSAKPPNKTNEGIEAVHQALSWGGFQAHGDWDPHRQWSNTDEDALGIPESAWPGPELHEFRDAWGHPFVYFRADEYETVAEGGAEHVNGMGDEVVARPRREADGSFARPDSYQLFSMGPDGEPNTEDDLVMDDLRIGR